MVTKWPDSNTERPFQISRSDEKDLQKEHKSEWARHTWECVAPIHIRGYCPHPSNHLRRRIHQPSLLPHNIHRNACAVQQSFCKTIGIDEIASEKRMECREAVDLACDLKSVGV